MNYYDKINWKNRSEGKTTKISAERLNHMDNQIFNNANAIGNVEKIADIGDGTLCDGVSSLKKTTDTISQNLENVTTTTKWVTQKTGTGVRYLSSDNGVQVTNEKHNKFTNIQALDFITEKGSINDLYSNAYAALQTLNGLATVNYGRNFNRGIIICNSALTTKISANKWITVATLPSGYRPCVTTPFSCHYGNILIVGLIQTNGNIQVYSSAELPANSQALSINTEYIII